MTIDDAIKNGMGKEEYIQFRFDPKNVDLFMLCVPSTPEKVSEQWDATTKLLGQLENKPDNEEKIIEALAKMNIGSDFG